VRPYPLISIIYLCLERQASSYLGPVLVQILRPYLGHRPLVVLTMLYLQRRPLDTLWLPWPYHSLNWEHLAQTLGLHHNNLLLKLSLQSPWELYKNGSINILAKYEFELLRFLKKYQK
jgi:hypothetical protein